MIMNQLGIYGWKEADENLVLASLLTGDPLLLIGNHGCAKTHVANKVAQAVDGSSWHTTRGEPPLAIMTSIFCNLLVCGKRSGLPLLGNRTVRCMFE